MGDLADIFTQRAVSDTKKEIVMQLLNSNEHLEEKTELAKPIAWSTLEAIREYLATLGLTRSAQIIERFMHQSFRFLISHSRQGRGEYIEALKALSAMADETEEDPTALG